MKLVKKRRLLSVAVIFAGILFLASGCAVLTNSQVKAVQKYASESEGFYKLPSDVIDEYNNISKDIAVLNVDRLNSIKKDKNVEKMYSTLSSSVDVSIRLNKNSQQLESALSILNKYSKLLLILSSDDFTEELDEQCIKLGEEINKGIEKYNKTYGANISDAGAISAAIIRGIFGIVIRHKQQESLKKYVKLANTTIAALCKDIISTTKQLEGNIKALQVDNKNYFMAKAKKNQLSKNDIIKTQEILFRIKKAVFLAQSCILITRKLKEAHEKLSENFDEKINIKILKASIEALVKEIKASDRIRKELKN